MFGVGSLMLVHRLARGQQRLLPIVDDVLALPSPARHLVVAGVDVVLGLAHVHTLAPPGSDVCSIALTSAVGDRRGQ